jgi:hypothetical protein
MLQRSPEYNFDYAQKIMTMSPLDLEDLVYNALRYTGQDTSINLTSYETHMSEDLGIYLENYLEDVSELLPKFVDSEYAPRKLKKDTKDLNVKYFLMDIRLTNTKNKLFIPFKGMTDQGPLYRSVNVSTLSGLLDYLEENGLNDPQVIVYID